MKLHVLSVFTFLLFFAGEPRTDELAAANAYLEGRWEVDGHSDLHSIVFHEGNIVTFHTKQIPTIRNMLINFATKSIAYRQVIS